MSSLYRYLGLGCIVRYTGRCKLKSRIYPQPQRNGTAYFTFHFWGLYGDSRAGGIRFRNFWQAH